MAPSFTHLTKPPSATSEHTIADRNCVWQQPRRWITMDSLVVHIAPARPRHSCRKFASPATLLSHQNERQINVHLRARTCNLCTTTASFHNTYNQHAALLEFGSLLIRVSSKAHLVSQNLKGFFFPFTQHGTSPHQASPHNITDADSTYSHRTYHVRRRRIRSSPEGPLTLLDTTKGVTGATMVSSSFLPVERTKRSSPIDESHRR
ncbi:hypothetical protein DEO72_LG3g827 [Vigna unguiculata]|uniref:Uncharacterized protein n=1 Tax=Vigna unguiculata TaxID=3917 RepID=A0A4D6LD32_VIGUN|nr:hypothetical protein DEO72_LG3g827 [Vigna unguiculata]